MLKQSKLLNGALFVALFTIVPLASAHASVNLLTNGSFEDGNFVPDGNGVESLAPGSTEIAGWTVIGNEMTWDSNSNPVGITGSDGTHFLDLTGYHDSPPYGGVSQTIDTIVGRTYTVSFDVGDSAAVGASANGPVTVLSQAGTGGGTFTVGPSGSGNQWGRFSYDFTATDKTTDISFIGAHGMTYIGLDNASVTLAPVPEASTMVLFALGAGALLLVARKKSAQAAT